MRKVRPALTAALAAYSATNTGIIVNTGNYSEAVVVNVSGAITRVESFGVGTAQAAETLTSASVNVTEQAKRIH